MTGKPEILFLAHRIPYPPDKGDKIRSWRMLSHLAERYDVHLGCFVDDPADMAHRAFLEKMTASAAFVPLDPKLARLRSLAALADGRPLSFAYFDDARMREYVSGVRKRDLVGEIVFSSSMAPYISQAKGDRPRVIDLCDADSEKWRDYAATARGVMRAVYAREAKRLAAAETDIVNWADAALAISAADAEILAHRPRVQKPVLRFGAGVDAEAFSPQADVMMLHKVYDIVFVGAMDYRANVEAARWFVRTVWPLIRGAEPDATFAIVGARPTKALRGLSGRNGVSVTGRVDDVRPYLRFARAVVAPLRVARGVQNKALEAMAMARPLVTTSAVANAIKARAGEELLVADAPEDFAAAVLELFSSPDKGKAIGAAARARILKEFTWQAKLAEFDAALKVAGVS